MMGGEVRQRLLSLPEPVTQDQLSQSSERLTQFFAGSDVDEMRARLAQLQGLDADVTAWIIEDMIPVHMIINFAAQIHDLRFYYAFLCHFITHTRSPFY